MSGMRRSRYSRGEHFRSWKKVWTALFNILKIFVLLILYLIVRYMDIKQKIDQRRQRWTCEILLFYNYILLLSVALTLALRVTTVQVLLLIETILMALVILFFIFQSIRLFIISLDLYEDLPDSEVNRIPESTLLYIIFILCFLSNLISMIIVGYFLGYIGMMTYQLRGVLFQDDMVET